MRKICVVLVLAFILFATPTAVLAVDWHLFYNSERADYYFDKDSLTLTWDNKIRVHEQIILQTVEEVMEFQKKTNIDRPVSHIIMALEYDFNADTVRTLEIQSFFKNELVYYNVDPQPAKKIAMNSPAHIALQMYLKLLQPVSHGGC